MEIKIPTLLEMLKAGMHFGHKKSKRHPKMEEYIYTTRAGINIIDLNQTIDKLKKILEEVKEFSSKGKKIIFVGTKKQAQKIVKKYAIECEMPYVINRWIGGAFTNFSVFSKNIKEYIDLKKKLTSGELDKYTKKERLLVKRKIDKLEEMVGGLVSLTNLPDGMFVVDIKKDKIAVKEAVKMNIPVFAICDTNCNPKDIKWMIPSNDDAVKSIELVIRSIAEAIKEGKIDKTSETKKVDINQSK
ncbi:30S ribosomal protein S2 [Patescibacteria group bacterium]